MKKSKKESFILYLDSRNLLDCLDYEKKGRLIEAIFAYVAGEEVPSLSPDVKIVFISIKTYLDKDREKYLEKCEKNSKNQKARWKNRNVYDRIQTYSNDTDNDTDNESGEYIYINQPKGPEEVVAFIEKNWNWESDAATQWGERFFYHYDAQGWVLGNGRPIQDWRSALYNFVDGKRNIKLCGE